MRASQGDENKKTARYKQDRQSHLRTSRWSNTNEGTKADITRLKSLETGKTKGKRGKSEKIPTDSDILKLLQARTFR